MFNPNDIYAQLMGQMSGRQGLPGNMDYLMRLLYMMPQQQQGQAQQSGGQQQGGMAGMSIYGGENPYLKDMQMKEEAAQRMAGTMSGAYGGMTGDRSFLNQSNYFGLLQKLFGVNPIQGGR